MNHPEFSNNENLGFFYEKNDSLRTPVVDNFESAKVELNDKQNIYKKV